MSHSPASQIEALLKLAGERDRPSAPAMERAREAAHASWQRALVAATDGERRAFPARLFLGWALAAGFVAAAAFLGFRDTTAPMPEVARIVALDGESHDASGARMTSGRVLRAGEVLATADGRLALAIGDALSLRLDHGTRLRLVSAANVELVTGALYVDSGGLSAHAALRIDTPAGAVRHLGTQYQVRVQGALTRVQVREGRVVLTGPGAAADLAAGDVADAAGGKVVVRHGAPVHGADWEWAAATAPAFDIENRPLSEFLGWLAREHGWQLRFVDAATQSRAQSIRLHGSMSGLDAAGMLERASLVTGVTLSASDGVLWVGARR